MHVIFTANKAKDFFKPVRIKDPNNLKKCIKLSKCCQICGSNNNVSAHHIKFRSERGDDSLGNLITLCFYCHRKAHDGIYVGKSDEAVFLSARDFIIRAIEVLNNRRYDKALIELRKKSK